MVLSNVAAVWQHHTLMLSLDFRPKSVWVKLGLTVAVGFYVMLSVLVTVDWLENVQQGGRSFWDEFPAALLLLAFFLEIILLFVLQLMAGYSVTMRRRLFRRMMDLRQRYPFITRPAEDKYWIWRYATLRTQIESARFGLFFLALLVIMLPYRFVTGW